VLFFIVWLILAFLCGKYADKKGISFAKFFWISILLSPVISFIWCAVSEEDSRLVERKAIDSNQYKRCPDCKELVRFTANRCRHCSSDFTKGEKVIDGKEVCTKCGEARMGTAIKKCLKCGKLFRN